MVIQEEDNIIMDQTMELIAEYQIVDDSQVNVANLLHSTLYNKCLHNLQNTMLKEGEVTHDVICMVKGEYKYADLWEYVEALPYKHILVSTRFYYMYLENQLMNKMGMDWTLHKDESNLLTLRGKIGDKNIYCMAVDMPRYDGLIINTDTLGYKFHGTMIDGQEGDQLIKTLRLDYGIRDTPKINIKVFTDSDSSEYQTFKRQQIIEDIIKD